MEVRRDWFPDGCVDRSEGSCSALRVFSQPGIALGCLGTACRGPGIDFFSIGEADCGNYSHGGPPPAQDKAAGESKKATEEVDGVRLADSAICKVYVCLECSFKTGGERDL